MKDRVELIMTYTIDIKERVKLIMEYTIDVRDSRTDYGIHNRYEGQ